MARYRITDSGQEIAGDPEHVVEEIRQMNARTAAMAPEEYVVATAELLAALGHPPTDADPEAILDVWLEIGVLQALDG